MERYVSEVVPLIPVFLFINTQVQLFFLKVLMDCIGLIEKSQISSQANLICSRRPFWIQGAALLFVEDLM